MKLSLVVMTPGKQEGKALELKGAEFVIGRDPQCHLRPSSPMISKRHCAIVQRDGKAFLKDFGSTNGSFVNDEQVKGEIELNNEDRVKVGPLLFTVKLETTVPVNRPTPIPATRAAEKPAAEGPRTPPPTKGKTDDDEVAAMLMGLDEDDPSAPASGSGIPEGSTQMEIPIKSGSLPPEPVAAGVGKDGKPKEDKAKAAKDQQASSSSAAKSILDQMMKRPRT